MGLYWVLLLGLAGFGVVLAGTWTNMGAGNANAPYSPTFKDLKGTITYSSAPGCLSGACLTPYVFSITPNVDVDPDFYNYYDMKNPVTNHAQSPKVMCTSISFVFTVLSLPTAELKISDKKPSKTFFECVRCNTASPSVMPPLFNSTSGSVTIQVSGSSDAASQESTFSLQYFCNVDYTTNAQAEDSRLGDLRDIRMEINTGYGTIRPLLSNWYHANYAADRGDFGLYLPAGTSQKFRIVYPSGSTIRFAITMLNWSPALTLEIYQDWDPNNWNPANVQIPSGGTANWFNSLDRKKWITSSTGIALIVLKNPLSLTRGQFYDLPVYFELDFYVDSNMWNCGEMLLPNRLIADSWVLTDGSKHLAPASTQRTAFLGGASSCEWLISPFTNSLITLIFSRVSLKEGSRVVVYDSNQANGIVLWDSGQIHSNGKFAGESFTTPPPIVSSGNSLYIVYKTDPRTTQQSYYGFFGEYFGNTLNSIGFGNNQATLSMSSAIDIAPPGNGSKYADGLTYTWLIAPIAMINYVPVSVGPITFAISGLSLPLGDSLTLYDSAVPSDASIIHVFSGNQLPLVWFKASSSKASMRFKSNGDFKSGTVKVSYFSDGPNYHCGFSRNPATLTAASMTFTDGSYSDEIVYSNQLCEWTLAPQGAVGVFLSFNRYTLYGGTISIYDGPVASGRLIAVISNTAAVPAPIFLNSPSMGVAYSSGASVTGRGFSATYFGVGTTYAAKPGDDVIKLYSSSMQSLTYASYNNLVYNTTIKYLVKPIPVRGSIYFSVSSLNLSESSDCNMTKLEILDGDQTAFNLTALKMQFYANKNLSYFNHTLQNFTQPDYRLKTFCGRDLPAKWIKASSVATILFTSYSSSSVPLRANFDLAYYSDGPNNHCGFLANPGLFTADSMVFTDGSSSREPLYVGSNCQLIIAPRHVTSSGLVMLEFLKNDLRGATLEVHEGKEVGINSLRWRCDSCTVIPRPLVSRAGAFFLQYTSANKNSTTRGGGFKAIYWTLNSTASGTFDKSSGALLELPIAYDLSNSVNNRTTFWSLGVSEVSSQLGFYPRFLLNVATDVTDHSRDGRPDNSSFRSLTGTVKTCGIVKSLSLQPNALANVNNSIFMTATQYATYLSSTISSKVVYATAGSSDVSAASLSSVPFSPAAVCKYRIDSGTSQSVLLTILSFNPSGGRLRIYGEVVPYQLIGNNAVLFDSMIMPVPATGMVAWCGVATIVLEAAAGADVNHALQLAYQINTLDLGQVCLDYKLSLLPKVLKPDPLIPLYIAFGALGACCLSFVLFYHLRRYLRKNWPEGGIVGMCYQRMRTYQVVTPRHLRYTPRMDEIRNRFLPIGQCCICQDDKLPVFYMDCNHALCVEDIKGYLASALGDISMIPVKCPLHYEGCAGHIEANIAKRVLNRVMFDKFNEFSDRATYGEGMRCIFCDNFVNFPIEGERSMVECPYCVQRFCMRCKKSWHFGSRCPLDKVDDTLDSWRMESMAQKCPCCHKLIEKDDPDTCNHMVHKVTDGIPCLRDRTDFCCESHLLYVLGGLDSVMFSHASQPFSNPPHPPHPPQTHRTTDLCGDEVTPDYPHEEVKNPGINHFPDGVFQKCRKVAQKERDTERDRLKKLRRKKGPKPSERAVGFGYGILGADENNPEYDGFEDDTFKDDYADNLPGGDDAFDQQWTTVMRSGPKRSSPTTAGELFVSVTNNGRPLGMTANGSPGSSRRASSVSPVSRISPNG